MGGAVFFVNCLIQSRPSVSPPQRAAQVEIWSRTRASQRYVQRAAWTPDAAHCNELFCEIGFHAQQLRLQDWGVIHFLGGRDVAGPTEPLPIRSIDNQDNPSHLTPEPNVDVAKCVASKASLKGCWSKSMRRPHPFYLADTSAPGVRHIMPCSSDWGKRGALPKVRIGDCDQEPDATCPTVYARNVP